MVASTEGRARGGAALRGLRAAQLIALAWLALGCSRSGDDPVTTAPAASDVRSCADAIERAVTAGSARAQVAAIATGCAAACPGLADYGRQLAVPIAPPSRRRTRQPAPTAPPAPPLRALASCGLFCDDAAARAWDAAAPTQRFDAVVDACGPEHFGLRADDRALMSDTWLVLWRVDGWLRGWRDSSAVRDADTAQALEAATTRAHIALPLPTVAAGLYALPTAREARPPDAMFYAVVGPAAVRLAAVPVARMRGEPRLDRRLVPGGHFPGQEVAFAELATQYAEMRRLLAALHHDAELDARARSPLLLASGDVLAPRIIEVAAALDAIEVSLGVAGLSAQAHPVSLRPVPRSGTAAPLLEIRATEYVISGELTLHVNRGDGELERLEDDLAHIAVMQAPQDQVELSLLPTTTVAELARLLDVLAAANFRVALYRPAALTRGE